MAGAFLCTWLGLGLGLGLGLELGLGLGLGRCTLMYLIVGLRSIVDALHIEWRVGPEPAVVVSRDLVRVRIRVRTLGLGLGLGSG